MKSTQRTITGFVMIGAGVIVAIFGYLGVSDETEVAFQLPYFASAGIGALLLMGFGATMLVNAQLATEDARLEEIEDAIRTLAAEIGRLSDEVTEGRSRLRAVRSVGSRNPVSRSSTR